MRYRYVATRFKIWCVKTHFFVIAAFGYCSIWIFVSLDIAWIIHMWFFYFCRQMVRQDAECGVHYFRAYLLEPPWPRMAAWDFGSLIKRLRLDDLEKTLWLPNEYDGCECPVFRASYQAANQPLRVRVVCCAREYTRNGRSEWTHLCWRMNESAWFWIAGTLTRRWERFSSQELDWFFHRALHLSLFDTKQ